MKRKIKDYAYSSPVWTAVETALIAVLLFSLLSVIKAGETTEFILHIICHVMSVVFAVFVAKACDFKLFAKIKISVSEIFILFLGLLVCVNNFPVIGFIKGDVRLIENANILRFILYCVMIGVSEEFVFRGIIMPIIGLKYKDAKRAPLLTVAVSSLIFSLCHLFNIFSLGIAPTLLQVGYTFLTGGLFGIAFLITKNLIFPIILHVVFDFGGLIFSVPFGVAAGNMWDLSTIIITAALGVFAAAVYILKLYKYKSNQNQK